MPPPTKKAKTDTADNEYMWLYQLDEDEAAFRLFEDWEELEENYWHMLYYEFHPDLQQHIESSYISGKPSCKVYVFGRDWTIDFKKMRRSGDDIMETRIRRIKKSALKKVKGVMGVSGMNYDLAEGFSQTADVCSVCRYRATIPTRVEGCGHEFCFLCLKHAYRRGSEECPTCQGPIPGILFSTWMKKTNMDIHMECPPGFINDVYASNTPGKGKKATLPVPLRRSARLKHYWLFESQTFGWFRYDPKSEHYIEQAYQQGKSELKLYIGGKERTIDFEKKTQTNFRLSVWFRFDIRRIQRIKPTELDQYRVVGIAGVPGYVRPIE